MREHFKALQRQPKLRRKPLLKTNITTKRNRVKFTADQVRRFKCSPERKEELLWDTDEKTLCIRARPSGSRSYYYQSRFDGRVIKIRIGSLSDTKLTFDHARSKAREFESLVYRGIDPRLEIKRNIQKEEAARIKIVKNSIHYWKVQNDYIESFKEDWSDSHLNDYIKSLEKTNRGRDGILLIFKDTKLCDFTPDLILAWLREEKKYRPTAAAKGYRLMRACLKWANGQGKYKDVLDIELLFNNTQIKKILPKSKARTESLQKEQLPSWFSAVRAIDNTVIAACLQTLLLTGARREEVLSLKWVDVDFQWLSLRIKDKVEGERIIPLTPYVAEILNSLPRRNKWVFSSVTSESGRLQEPYIAHSNALETAELPKLSIHDLRRSFSTLSEWVECPIGIVAQIQGHKPSATVEKHYKARPLDLLRLWHTNIEAKILSFANIEQPEEIKSEVLSLVTK